MDEAQDTIAAIGILITAALAFYTWKRSKYPSSPLVQDGRAARAEARSQVPGAYPSQGASPVALSTRRSPGVSACAANSCAAALNRSAAAIRDS